jgi:hypothetical protein
MDLLLTMTADNLDCARSMRYQRGRNTTQKGSTNDTQATRTDEDRVGIPGLRFTKKHFPGIVFFDHRNRPEAGIFQPRSGSFGHTLAAMNLLYIGLQERCARQHRV